MRLGRRVVMTMIGLMGGGRKIGRKRNEWMGGGMGMMSCLDDVWVVLVHVVVSSKVAIQ